MARKPKLPEEFGDINIMPLMNIIMLLIPFLIMSTEFLRIGVINVSAPRIAPGAAQPDPSDQPKKPLNLTIQVSSKGFTLITQSQKLPQGCDLKALQEQGEKKFPTLPLGADGKYDYVGLHNCLVKIKKVFSEEKRVIIQADPDIPYFVVVGVMDGSRKMKGDKGDTELFNEVIISAGVV